MGDDRGHRPPGADRWAAGARNPRWPLPDRGHAPVEPAGRESSMFTSTGARHGDGSLGSPEFDTVRRGYDPAQVDSYVESLSARAGAADDDRRRADIAEDQLREALAELKQARRAPTGGARTAGPAEQAPSVEHSEGFGLRVERMLREAQREAEQERAAAVEQAAHILARARAEAEAHRRDVERSLAERTAATQDELRGREAEIAERERGVTEREGEVAERISIARAEAGAIIEAAEEEAGKRSRELLDRAEREAASERDRANRDIVRLTEARRYLRTELARLHRDLGHRLAERPDAADAGSALAPSQRTTSGFDPRAGVTRKVR